MIKAKETTQIQILGKIPPQATDLEMVVIGSMLIDNYCIPTVCDILSGESFYHDSYRTIFETAKKMYDEGSAIDILTVTQRLKKESKLDLVGGIHFISQLTNTVASTANVEHHCRIIQQMHMKRQAIFLGNKLISEAYDDTTDSFDIVVSAIETLNSIELGVSDVEITSVNAMAMESLKKIYQEVEDVSKGIKVGIPTFSDRINQFVGGFIPGGLSIIAARPGEGKTACMLQCCLAQFRHNKSIGIISLEMSKHLLMKRLYSNLADVDGYDLRDAKLCNAQFDRMKSAAEYLSKCKMHVVDDVNITLKKLRPIIRKMVMLHGCEIVYIDYFQLIDANDTASKFDNQLIINEKISKKLQKIAREFNIAIVALSQLRREGDKKPTIESLRGGGIEQASDLIISLFDEGYQNDSASDASHVEMLAIVNKAKHGSTGEVPIVYNKVHQKMYDDLVPRSYKSAVKQSIRNVPDDIKDLF